MRISELSGVGRALLPGDAAYTRAMVVTLFSAVRLWWTGSKGYRLRPWLSPYLRWRMETYSGKPAATLKFGDFWALALAERKQVSSYLAWVGELRSLAGEKKSQS